MGDVTITIQDGGANTVVNVPSARVRVKIGCLLTGISQTAALYQVIAAANANVLAAAFVGGALMEAAGLVCAAGGIVLAIGVPVATPGTATALVTTGVAGTSVITATLDGTNGAWDSYYVKFLCTTGGTIGSAGIQFKVSLDAGRNYGPIISLGTAVTYLIPGTGITLNFAAGTLIAADHAEFSTTAPAWNTAGVQNAITALKASPYALTGWGGMHLVGPATGANATTFQGYIGGTPDGSGGLAGDAVYTRLLLDTADAAAPVAWGGAGQTEAAWISALETSFSATSAKRCCATAGYYNMPTAYPTAAAGSPSYRRPLAWALDVREALIPPQRHAGRVRDGALGNIVVNPSSDPTDGFVYHDERITPGLTGTRFTAAKTRVKRQGFYIDQPNLMSATGSVFTLLPYGNVIDVACGIAFDVGSGEINDDLRTQSNGTMYPTDRVSLQNLIQDNLKSQMTNQNMISGSSVSIDPNTNLRNTGNVPIQVSVERNGYILSETITVGFAAPTAAGG